MDLELKKQERRMLLEMITIVAFAVLYGLAWHDQPAQKPERIRAENRKEPQ